VKNLALALTFCLFCLSCCVPSVHADDQDDWYDDDVKKVEQMQRRCKEATSRCNRATTSARTKKEYDAAADTCHKAASICRKGTNFVHDLL
jgi:hypothetical protein